MLVLLVLLLVLRERLLLRERHGDATVELLVVRTIRGPVAQ